MTTKELNQKAFSYIINCVDGEGYGRELNNAQEKLQFVADTFKAEYVCPENLRRYGSYQEVFRQWLMGLPSSFNVDFENYRIIEIAKEWGSIPTNATERQEQKIIDNWFNLIASKTFQLMKKHKVLPH